MTEGELDLQDIIYGALVEKHYQLMEPGMKNVLLELWLSHPETHPEGLDPDYVRAHPEEYGAVFEPTPIDDQRFSQVTAFLVEEIETLEEWEDHKVEWVTIGHQILGFLEYLDEQKGE